jgi:Asp-tRNA(Asn)/Glu-tRNA(Gln) amidotransferase B subunit
MSAMEKNLYNIETMRQEGPKQRMAEREARRIESNQQWNKAKEQVYNLIGGTQGLAELLNAQEQPLIQGLEYDANIPANRPKLANELAQKIREKIATGTGNKKLEGFEQKLERLGPQKVSQEEIIAAVVEEIIQAQESAVGKVRTMSNVPTTPTSTTADGKTGTLSPPQ